MHSAPPIRHRLRLHFPALPDDNQPCLAPAFTRTANRQPLPSRRACDRDADQPARKFWGAILHLAAKASACAASISPASTNLLPRSRTASHSLPASSFFRCIAWSGWNLIFPKATFSRSPSVSRRKPDKTGAILTSEFSRTRSHTPRGMPAEKIAVNLRQILTAPNQLTLLRMIFLPFIVINLVKQDFKWALALFVLAGLSDGLDGLLARTLHQQTLLGQYLDPSPTSC